MIKELLKQADIDKGVFWSHPWGLVRGCNAVSPGCVNCWLVRMTRLQQNGDKYLYRDKSHFNGTVDFIDSKLTEPIASKHRKPRVWAIWSDFFHADVPGSCRDNAIDIMRQCPNDVFLIVTKRPHVAVDWARPTNLVDNLPLRNVIILVTMESQKEVNNRYPPAARLAKTVWKVGILAEPLLSPVNLCLDIWPVLPKWIITGPETGAGKRECKQEWLISLRDQAEAAGIPFWLKKGCIDGRIYRETP